MSIVEMTTGDIKSPQRLARLDISVVMAVDGINNGRCIRYLVFMRLACLFLFTDANGGGIRVVMANTRVECRA